jgi:hypothetical protein
VSYTKPRCFRDKNVERQFSKFLTERSSKCIISQCELPLSNCYRVSGCVFSRANNSSTRRRLSTDDHSIVPDTAYPDFRTLSAPNSLQKSVYNGSNKFLRYNICIAFRSLSTDARTKFRPYAPCTPLSPIHYSLWEKRFSHNQTTKTVHLSICM